MNLDSLLRKFRLIEVLADSELKRSRKAWSLVEGWLLKAEEISPGTAKALLEGDWVATLPDGSRFKEVSFKTEHAKIEEALDLWSKQAGRRWAMVTGDFFLLSDGSKMPLADISTEQVR